MIEYVGGDATAPKVSGNQIVAHICNDIGAWGKGFVLAVSARWPEPEIAFRTWFHDRAQNNFALGEVQLVQVQSRIWVANMIAQRGIRSHKTPPIRYDALAVCLQKLAREALNLNASIHMPRIGCGLAGGKWDLVEPLIEINLCAAGLAVCVYDLEKSPKLK